MTVSTAQKLAAVERLIEDFRWSRGQGSLESETHAALIAIAADLRSGTSKEIGRVLMAMTDQVERARRGKNRLGFYEIGNAQTICEAICGRWWPVIEAALRRYEQQGTEHEKIARG